MTEPEWWACADPEPILEFLTNKVDDRKLRLFAVAYCYRIGHSLRADFRQAVEVAEQFADRSISREAFLEMEKTVDDAEVVTALDSIVHDAVGTAFYSEDFPFLKVHVFLKHGSYTAAEAEGWRGDGQNVEAEARAKAAQSDLLRDIFGNPFRPVAVDPSWLTSDVLALAEGIYQERVFDRMPVLADALQDAGCDSDDILNHCRQPGEHVRGCWVVDLLTGRK